MPWIELDDKIIECKEYQEKNRATFDQVVTDISCLVEQITDLERAETVPRGHCEDVNGNQSS